jgi:cytoskeletal protein RodZ
MATQMQGLKEEDLERMMAMATKLNKAKVFVMKNKLILIAVFVLLIGLLLRWLGWA